MKHLKQTKDKEQLNSNPPQISKQKKWNVILMKRYWDYTLSFLFLVGCCVLAFFIYKFNILTLQTFSMIALLMVILNLLFFLLIFIRKIPNWGIWIRRILLVVLCIGFAYGSFTLHTIYGALEAITKPETATTVNVSLITRKEGGARQLKELSTKKIGIQTGADAINSTYVKNELAKESDLTNVTYVEALDYASLYDSLAKGEIDALIITEAYYKSILKDSYPTIEEDIFLLKSYQKEKESDASTSTKDIRYEPFTIYIAGVDEGDDPSIPARSDVNIVLMVNPLANHIEMVSIPRDSFVPNPALNNASDKLTHLGLAGVENSMKGLEHVLGFPIDYYVKLNFFSVIEIVDAIGKIEVDVPVSFCEQDEYRSFAQEDLICLNEGVQTLNGKQTLAFARHRKSYTDVMRGKAQQEIIRGIIDALTSPSGAANINQVMKIAPKSVVTNIPLDQVTSFISLQLENLKPWTIDSIVLENGVDATLLTASMPSTPLSVLLLNYYDITGIFDAYQEMLNQMQLASFDFNLNDLEQDKVEMPQSIANILWAGMNTSNYQEKETTPQKENTTQTPPAVTTPTPPTPQEPKKEEVTPPTNQPTTPETPNVPPSPPTTDGEQTETPNTSGGNTNTGTNSTTGS